MAYTTRSDAREVPCPACPADTGEKCIGARGRKRESVHAERWQRAAAHHDHAPTTVVHVEGAAMYDNDGKPLGRALSMDIVLQSEEEWGEPTEGGEEEVEVESSPTPELSQSGGGAGGPGGESQTALLPDPVEETWALYAELLDRPKAQLTPKVRRYIAEAHKVGVEETRQAIRGLAASDYHRQNGYVGIEYAIVAKRGETIEGRLLMMAAKGGHSPNGPTTVDRLVARLPSEAQPMVRQWIRDVEDMLRNPDHPGLAQTGQSRLNSLRDRAQMEPIISGTRIVDWRDLRR